METVKSFPIVDTLGGLTISEHPVLTHVERIGVPQLTLINGSVTFTFNPLLADLDFMTKIEKIDYGGLELQFLNSLPDLVGLSALRFIAIGLHLANLPLIENLEPLKNLTFIGPTFFDEFRAIAGGGFGLVVKNNANLTTLDGLRSLQIVDGPIDIRGNPQLVSVSGLCDIGTVGGIITIGGPRLCCPSIDAVFGNHYQYLTLSQCANLCEETNNYTCSCSSATGLPVQRCLNGGTCFSIPNGFRCSCLAPYTGPTCAIPRPQMKTLIPSTTSLRGTVNMTLTGIRFPNTSVDTLLYVENKQVLFRNWTLSSGNSEPSFSLVFTAPALNTTPGYKRITIQSAFTPIQNESRTNLIYYVPVSLQYCLDPGLFWDGSQCLDCPTGCNCPGGDRCWPRQGYWSPNENTAAGACLIDEACPGANGENPNYPIQILPTGKRKTAICATLIGYSGDFCQTCLDGYFSDGAIRCRYCGGASSNLRDFVGLILGATVFYVGISIAIATLKDKHLVNIVTALVLTQQFIIIGSSASPYFNEDAANAWSVLTLFALDVNFFRPGCTIPRFDFVTLFWLTIVIFLCAGVLFTLAALLRAVFLPISKKKASRISRFKVFKRRLVHAMIILGCICYLQFCLRAFQGLTCNNVNGSLRLRVELNVTCYSSEHLATAVAIYFLLVFYAFGFPAWCAYILRRVARLRESIHAGLTDPKREAKYYFLYRDCKPEFYWFRWLSFLTSFLLALESTVSTSIGVSMFIAFLLFLANIWLVIWLWPFERWYQNLRTLAAGLASVGQAMYYMYFLDRRYFEATFALLVFFIAWSLLFRYFGITLKRVEQWLGIQQKLQAKSPAEKTVELGSPGGTPGELKEISRASVSEFKDNDLMSGSTDDLTAEGIGMEQLALRRRVSAKGDDGESDWQREGSSESALLVLSNSRPAAISNSTGEPTEAFSSTSSGIESEESIGKLGRLTRGLSNPKPKESLLLTTDTQKLTPQSEKEQPFSTTTLSTRHSDSDEPDSSNAFAPLLRTDSTTTKRSEERFSRNAETDLVCRLLLEKKKMTSYA
eukprot:TRINITY_DN763_c0_g1_i10.p1 TRINITY_DN763_c0_g1~~TRINITY_DN763_c0_g1_i10.p1  ORF type:complete len:1178 (-),score=130.33 TRINITY_DN763_c0_g1_i10:10-3168(-)